MFQPFNTTVDSLCTTFETLSIKFESFYTNVDVFYFTFDTFCTGLESFCTKFDSFSIKFDAFYSNVPSFCSAFDTFYINVPSFSINVGTLKYGGVLPKWGTPPPMYPQKPVKAVFGIWFQTGNRSLHSKKKLRFQEDSFQSTIIFKQCIHLTNFKPKHAL